MKAPMTQSGDQALLPAGFQDVLPPQAAQEAAVIERLIACFAGHGYERVKPPLLEFEETILAGAGAAVAPQTFRLMDPVSQRMMGLRADMTPQVARIAATRLRRAPRPLRLCYGGQVLRIKGGQLRPERQFAQVGVELIGAASERADAEVVLLAAEALGAIGIAGLSIDLNLPPLVGALAAGLDIDGERLGRCAGRSTARTRPRSPRSPAPRRTNSRPCCAPPVRPKRRWRRSRPWPWAAPPPPRSPA